MGGPLRTVGLLRGRRVVAPLLAVAAVSVTVACGGDEGRRQAKAGGAPARYSDVAAQYEMALGQQLTEGRAVTQQLVAGQLTTVCDRTAPEVKASVSLPEVERLFAELRAQASIGDRGEDRALPLGPGRGIYWADYSWGAGTLRFTVVFLESGLVPSVEPVTPLPPTPAPAGRLGPRYGFPSNRCGG